MMIRSAALLSARTPRLQAEEVRRWGRDLEEVYGAVIAHYAALGLLRRTAAGAALTAAGMKLGNEVFAAFLLEA